MNEVVREIIVLLQDAANRQSVSIRAELDGDVPTTTADRVQMQQVLMNLMLNGIEAMKDTRGELTIRSKKTEDCQILISVSDAGVGLPGENADRVFDAFFTTKSQGTGMGLSICRRIIESHGGRLWACANAGRGTTFHFTLPSAPSTNPDLPGGLTFAATIRVEPSDGKPSTPYASRTRDQANTAPWTGAWTIVLSNDLRQSFTPSLPKLTGVELELVVGNPGPASSTVTMTLLNAKGEVLSVVSKTVPVDDCGHVLFVFPKGGWRVSPGEVYSIEVHGDEGVFGWKYVVGGYSRGAASFNGKPLLQGARGTFLFQTFGAI